MSVWNTLLSAVDGDGSKDVLSQADLNWETDLLPMSVDITDEEMGSPIPVTVDGYVCVVRKDTNDQLGVVGSGYSPIQNELAFSLFDVVRKEGQLTFRSAGMFGNGELVVVLAQMAKPLVIDGDDVVTPYLMMHTSHDGSRALGIQMLGEFQGTNSVANIAMFGRRDGMAIRHSGAVKNKVKETRRIIAAATTAASGFQEIGRVLAKRYLTYNEVQAILKELIPDPKKEGASTARAVSKRQAIDTLYEVGEGSHLPSREGTAWGLYVAITAYNATERTTRGDKEDETNAGRLKSVWFGSSAAFNRTALGLLVERAAEGKSV